MQQYMPEVSGDGQDSVGTRRHLMAEAQEGQPRVKNVTTEMELKECVGFRMEKEPSKGT